MSGQVIGYVRVSTLEQNTGRQREQMKDEHLDDVYEDHISGKSLERPELDRLRRHVRKGDTVVVYSMDRLARNLRDLRNLVDELTDRGIVVRFLKEHLEFTGEPNSTAKLMLNIMGAVAEFERELILERQREGIALAKAEGKYKGGKFKLSAAKVRELNNRASAGNISKAALAREFGISRETLYQYLKADTSAKESVSKLSNETL
ncbi:recombinase family protein [Telmatobacter sp. DSM 110680]|uniref:Recombinase family protein n=1 Tax=Telmatobacter sp. DSM 110680 TaxID=3036704 RepID=A0AAU7DPY5_9BACT